MSDRPDGEYFLRHIADDDKTKPEWIIPAESIREVAVDFSKPEWLVSSATPPDILPPPAINGDTGPHGMGSD